MDAKLARVTCSGRILVVGLFFPPQGECKRQAPVERRGLCVSLGRRGLRRSACLGGSPCRLNVKLPQLATEKTGVYYPN